MHHPNIPIVILSRTRRARYSTPPNSSGVKDDKSIDSLLTLLSLRLALDVLPRTNMEDTTRSTEVALLMLLVLRILRVFDLVRRIA